jgi:crotonobetainyl-CoA:carnitine CoA-transferase CaiB-like acyl-CoA transferase
VNPINFRRSALQFDRAPPTLGQHTHEILGEIGWKDS